jgi:hypothetical protein
MAGWMQFIVIVQHNFQRTYGRRANSNMCQLHSPGCCESGIYHVLWLHICHSLNLVKIEWVFSSDGTIQTCLHKSGPIVLKHQLSTAIILTNAGNARVYNLKHNTHNMHFSHIILITCYMSIHLHTVKLPKAISISPWICVFPTAIQQPKWEVMLSQWLIRVLIYSLLRCEAT